VDRDLYSTSAPAVGDPYPDPPRSVVRRFLLALGAQADRAAGDALPGWLHRPSSMASQRRPGSRLLRVGTDIVRESRADVQRHVLAGRPDRPRDHQPNYLGPGSGRCISRAPTRRRAAPSRV